MVEKAPFARFNAQAPSHPQGMTGRLAMIQSQPREAYFFFGFMPAQICL